MDIEAILRRIENLDSQIKSLNKTLASHHIQIGDFEKDSDKTTEQIRDLKNDISKLSTLINRYGNYDTALTKLRVDVKKDIEEIEKRAQIQRKNSEKLFDNQFHSLEEKIVSENSALERKIEQKLAVFMDEDSRIVQEFKDIQNSLGNLVNFDWFKNELNSFEQELSTIKKISEARANQLEINLKRNEELRKTQEILGNEIKSNNNRITELVATENERRQAFVNFMGQQKIAEDDRERTWNEWQSEYENMQKQMVSLLPELQKKEFEFEKIKNAFDDSIAKIDRRIKEITETYRLREEKFQQDWAALQSDIEKRWTNISLNMEDKQSELLSTSKTFQERILKVEDDTHDMQEGFLLMSREIQKGMQGLMNMVNGWMSAFGDIKDNR